MGCSCLAPEAGIIQVLCGMKTRLLLLLLLLLRLLLPLLVLLLLLLLLLLPGVGDRELGCIRPYPYYLGVPFFP